MAKILNRKFYERNALIVARELLGKFIVRRIGGKKMIGRIVETEAYNGPRDLASHASRGRTDRNAPMFGPAGRAYVYMIYGMYYCFNIVTGDNGHPAAILIRAVEIAGCEDKIASGPGKFCRAFKIDRKLNEGDLTRKKNGIWLEDRKKIIKKTDIASAKRVGVDYAGEYKDKLWRFYIKGNQCVSKK